MPCGRPGVGDDYYPLYGNGGYDVAHYLLKLSYDPATDRLVGVATISEVVPLAVELRRRSMGAQAASSLAGVTAAVVWSSATRRAGR
jgi:hypothetical protein